MTFPYYHLYQSAIATRNWLVWGVFWIVLFGIGVLWLFVRSYPARRKLAVWIIGVGGFYVSLAGLVVLYFAGAARP